MVDALRRYPEPSSVGLAEFENEINGARHRCGAQRHSASIAPSRARWAKGRVRPLRVNPPLAASGTSSAVEPSPGSAHPPGEAGRRRTGRCAILRATQVFQALRLIFLQLEPNARRQAIITLRTCYLTR